LSLLFKNLSFLVLAWGVFILWLPLRVFERHPRWPDELEWRHWISLGIAGMAVLAYLHCHWLFLSRGRGTPFLFDPPVKLVQRGLYRWVRNPMYLAVLTLLAAQAVFLWSQHLAVYWLCTACLLQIMVHIQEERDLSFRFGAMYEDYKRAVPRWIPRAPRQLPAEHPSSSREH
jgi:protein-S-isoprenylcysteine O-methyltransferase Ste14